MWNVPYFIQIYCQVRAGRALPPLTNTRPHLMSHCPNISCKMAGLGEAWSNIEVHSVIRFLRLKGTSPVEIHHQLVDVYGANFVSRKHICVWCTAFDNGRTHSQPHTRVVTALQLGGTGPSSLQPWPSTKWFHLFGSLKKHLGERRFTTEGEVQQAVTSWLQALDTDFFYAGIDALMYQWDKCFSKYWDYVEK
jgi:hypothetical protein